MAIFKIEKKENFIIKLLGHNLVIIYRHYIMEFNRNISQNSNIGKFIAVNMSEEIIAKCNDSDFPVDYMLKLKKIYRKKFYGIALTTKDGEICGYICGLKPISKEVQYKIKRTEFFVKYIYVYEKYRGQGVVEELIDNLFEMLNLNQFRLAVRLNNVRAIKAYQKCSGKIIEKKVFARFLKLNIPYYSI